MTCLTDLFTKAHATFQTTTVDHPYRATHSQFTLIGESFTAE